MGSYNRASYPENFFDKTSDMLLVQPEPQYLYGTWFLNALAASLEEPDLSGIRNFPSVGQPYSAADRDRLMLAAPMSSEIFSAKVDFSAETGNTMKFSRPVFANTTYTEASRRIATGQTISTTPVTFQSEQTHLTLYKYGGPYDQTNSRIAPYAIEAFDANMGIHRPASIAGTHLKRDYHKFVDAVQVSLLDLGATAVYPEGMSAVDDATAVGSFPLTFEQVCRTEQLMDEANLPTFSDGFRALVLKPRQIKQLKASKEFRELSEVHQTFNSLFSGQYIASIGKFHIFKNNTLTSTNNSSSVAIDYGHAIAPGALMGGMGRRPRVAVADDTNYGEQAKLIWQSDLAFGLADSSFVYSVRSSQ